MRALIPQSYVLGAILSIVGCGGEIVEIPATDDGFGGSSPGFGGFVSGGRLGNGGVAGKGQSPSTGGTLGSPPTGNPTSGSPGVAGSGGTFGGIPSTGGTSPGVSGAGNGGRAGSGNSGSSSVNGGTGGTGGTNPGTGNPPSGTAGSAPAPGGPTGVAGRPAFPFPPPGGMQGMGGTAGMGGTGGTPGSVAGMAGRPNTNPPMGGSTGSAGAAGNPTTGNPTTGAPAANCTEAQGQVCNNQIGKHCGYTFEYWKDNGTGCMTNKADGFSVEWSNIGNLLGRKGVRPGSASNIVTYESNYQPNGNSYLCVYGWSRGPLVEYYIVDSWGTWRPPGGMGLMGTLQSDGGTYDIYRTQRVNQPSIDGTATFYQYWSVRQQKRSSGTITVANHFNGWASKGMNIGNLYEVSMTVEGYQSSGKADVKMSIR